MVLLKMEVSQINSLDVPEKEIKDLTGIGSFENLEYLFIPLNELTSLDVSYNIKLINLELQIVRHTLIIKLKKMLMKQFILCHHL